jgi:hypothetical protein
MSNYLFVRNSRNIARGPAVPEDLMLTAAKDRSDSSCGIAKESPTRHLPVVPYGSACNLNFSSHGSATVSPSLVVIRYWAPSFVKFSYGPI